MPSSHYLKQCCLTVNWTHGNKLKCSVNLSRQCLWKYIQQNIILFHHSVLNIDWGNINCMYDYLVILKLSLLKAVQTTFLCNSIGHILLFIYRYIVSISKPIISSIHLGLPAHIRRSNTLGWPWHPILPQHPWVEAKERLALLFSILFLDVFGQKLLTKDKVKEPKELLCVTQKLLWLLSLCFWSIFFDIFRCRKIIIVKNIWFI